MDRRQFLRVTAAGAPALFANPGSLFAQEFDLVIRGGRVIDPAQGLDHAADVGISAGQIAAIRPSIPATAAAKSIDATGKLVVPGLIDIHLHARDAELPPAKILETGVTSLIDGGSRGADNVAQLIQVAEAAPNRMRILLNIGRLGNNPNGRAEFLDGIDQADVAKCRAAVEQNRRWIVGLKARLSRGIAVDRDQEVLRRAVQVADPLNIPIMIHMGDTASPLPQLLAMLRPGDIVTHPYAPTPHGILDERGKILPEVRAARKRGILFDFGNGLNEHWNWEVAQKALKQDFPPDTLSTDLTIAGRTDQVIDLPNVMSKFLLMGMSLSEVVACVTQNASRAIREYRPYGSLRPGSIADVTVLELTQGTFSFVDNYKGMKTGMQRLMTRAVVLGGKQIV